MTKILATGDRVVLRRPRSSDAAPFLAAVRRSAGLHVPWVEPPRDERVFTAWVRSGRLASRELHLVCLHTGELVGVVNISEIVRGVLLSGYLGYFAFAPYAGKGLMREALDLVVERAFTSLALHRLEANIQPGNAASLHLVQRLGFRREGFSPRYLYIGGGWRDHERWAITVEDWRERGYRT